MQVKTFLIMGCLSLGALTVGCGSDSHDSHNMRGGMQVENNDDDFNVDPNEITYTCSVSISPGVLDFFLDGDFLTLSAATDPNDLVLTRDGSGSDLYDSWLAFESDDGVLASRLLFVIGPDSVTVRNECSGEDGAFGVAEATSRAIVTDTSIETLDEASEEIEF